MTGDDHYAAAEQLLATVDEQIRKGAPPEYVASGLAAAQVHATLATVQRNACPHDWIAPKKMGDGEGCTWVRVECALCGAVDDRPDSRTIPWPPSDELVERVARELAALGGRSWDALLPIRQDDYRAKARAVLDAIGGAGDE